MAVDPSVLQDVTTYLTRVDGLNNPLVLDQQAVAMGQNVVMRGGAPQTRPGSRTLATLPSGNMQGGGVFTPLNDAPQVLVAIDGYIYVIRYPYETYVRLDGIRFNPYSRVVNFQQCLKSTDVDGSGVPVALETPYPTVIIQDGNTRAAYYDGTQWKHLNPQLSGLDTTEEGLDETPIGLWMAWSGNRLWVARGGNVFASDFGNPYKFTETQYLAEGRAFYFPDEVTGFAEITNPVGLLVFTQSSTHRLQSNIADRTQWLSTANFQDVILSNIGCVSQRSVVNNSGFIWWYSLGGWINLDAALQAQRTSRIEYLDWPLSESKRELSSDLSIICSAAFENYILVSVPSGAIVNRHTWVLDMNPGDGQPAWNGWWTGWNPVVWLPVAASGVQRLMFLSRSNDNCNELWDAFQPDRTDNGLPIDCLVMTRLHDFNSIDDKVFRYVEFEAAEVFGRTSIMVARAQETGGWKPLGRFELNAFTGPITPESVLAANSPIVPLRPQSRQLRTEEDDRIDTPCNRCGIETGKQNATGRAFQVLFLWSGRMALKYYRLVARLEPRDLRGECSTDEVNSPRGVNVMGCGDYTNKIDLAALPVYVSTAIETIASPSGLTYTAASDAFSWVSQANADYKAVLTARLKAAVLSPEGRSNVIMVINDNPTKSLVPFTNRGFELAYTASSGGCTGAAYYS